MLISAFLIDRDSQLIVADFLIIRIFLPHNGTTEKIKQTFIEPLVCAIGLNHIQAHEV
ncbi:hypothetical protein [Microcoleus sp.]|uniref:hypothetical protein n=1 Tax=Microcoleus sp. TaxID=44472 RepID=UPI003592F0B7